MAAKNPCEAPGWDAEQPGSPGEDRQTLDCLFSATYEELRRLAATVRRDHPNTTLNPTALVNEARLKLSKSSKFGATSPLHFKRIAARAMRPVLVEAARRRRTGRLGPLYHRNSKSLRHTHRMNSSPQAHPLPNGNESQGPIGPDLTG